MIESIRIFRSSFLNHSLIHSIHIIRFRLLNRFNLILIREKENDIIQSKQWKINPLHIVNTIMIFQTTQNNKDIDKQIFHWSYSRSMNWTWIIRWIIFSIFRLTRFVIIWSWFRIIWIGSIIIVLIISLLTRYRRLTTNSFRYNRHFTLNTLVSLIRSPCVCACVFLYFYTAAITSICIYLYLIPHRWKVKTTFFFLRLLLLLLSLSHFSAFFLLLFTELRE